MSSPVSQNPLEQYEALEVIGNGSFGVIRKVRRRSDGVVLARKELNFERMTERDRKQIVAEVNILKDLCHENIVRYHDRYVDRDNGILYILMEYCGGGDLGSIIKSCSRNNRPLPEDTIWGYFLQILLALHHCHFPSTDESNSPPRQQILHRDLKPENVFLDENQVIKLGDFGLSKALGVAGFANTYVGTPYYMSPELMQEKSYDAKSDIWSLGCLMYELCALKPPFHEAKTHNELSIFIRNGRIPPLPRGYSQSLHQVIKAMLNINPAMRPSAQQLLQHERIELVHKVRETEKMLTLAKAHKQMLAARERELLHREREFQAREAELQQRVAQTLAQRQAELEALASRRVAEREAELRDAVMRKEEEVRDRMEKREAELLQAVLQREEQLRHLWEEYETGLRQELRSREEEVQKAEEYLKGEWEQLQAQKASIETSPAPSLALPERQDSPPAIATPIRAQRQHVPSPFSAMRGVILANGEAVPTPPPAPQPVELTRLLHESPRVKFNFTKIFDEQRGGRDYDEDSDVEDVGGSPEVPIDNARARNMSSSDRERDQEHTDEKENVSPRPLSAPAATRLRKPSIRGSIPRPSLPPSVASCPTALTSTANDISHPVSSQSVPPLPSAKYDPNDEANLPSPFLNRREREALSKGKTRRTSNAQELRMKVVTNNALQSGRKVPAGFNDKEMHLAAGSGSGGGGVRPPLERAKQASEGAKKALFRS
ncbi:kinase-like domain-containing protein [Hysterangium stoloniferum]|nr:kinase-like domain-containing protein [Hysterangium stoloniferum]